MRLPLLASNRVSSWLLVGLLAIGVTSVSTESQAQEPNPAAQNRGKARNRSTSSPKKPAEPKPAEPIKPEGEAIPAPGTFVPPANPEAAAQTGQPEGAVNPEPAPSTPPSGAEQLNPPTDESQMDPAKRAEEARRAAQERAKARRERTAGPGADPMPTTIPGQANQPPTRPNIPVPQPEGGAGNEPEIDTGPTTPLNIAPTESNVPPEQRTYGFSIKDGTYEMLIQGFAKQTGMGVIGDAPKEGKVTFVTTETLNFDQALARVRMLLFNYKAHEPYWILRNEDNLQVIRVNDFYRILPRNRMFSSVEEFREAKLSSDELALVIYTPKTGSVADLKQVRDWLPDYVRVTPLEDQNRVTIFALVSDIEKYLGLIDFMAGGRGDPRTLERIEIHHIMANDALAKLRSLMDLDGMSGGGKAAPVRAAGGRGTPREPSALDTMPDPTVSIIADDALGLLIVRAMKDKIEEMKLLLPYIDVDSSSQSPTPVIVKLQFVDAGDMITTIQQILNTSGSGPTPPTPKPKRGKKAGAAATPQAPATTGGEGGSDNVTLLSHPSDNAIIVLADEVGVARVRDLVQMFDVATRMNPVRIPLSHADANEVMNTVTAVLGTPGAKGKAPLERFQLIVDPSADAIWYSGGEKDLEKVREIIAVVDVSTDPVILHTVNCKYQTPTFLSNMLREFDSTNPGSGAPAPATKKPKTKRVKASAPASKFTPDDNRKQLFVICTDEEWPHYQDLIAQLDQPTGFGAAFVKIPLEHIEASEAVERIGAMLSAGGGEETAKLIAVDGAMLVIGANEEDITKIRAFLPEVDKKTILEKRTFEIVHANAGDVKTAIESLMGDASSSQPAPRKRGKGEPKGGTTIASSVSAELMITQVGQRLYVQTTPERMKEVADLISEFDVEEHKTELKVYSDFAPGTNIEALSDTVASVFGGGGGGSKRPGKEAVVVEGPRFIPQPASGRLVVIAEPSAFPEIERLLTVLRHDVESRPTIVAFVEVKEADPSDLVETIRPLLDIKISGLVAAGELEDTVEEGATPVGKSGVRKRSASATGGSTSDRYHLSADPRNKRIVVAAPQVIVDQAKTLISQFDLPGDKKILKRVVLANAAPADMVKAVTEMMGRPSTGRSRSTSSKNPAGKAAAAAPVFELSADQGLSVVEAPGGGAVLLRGVPAEVAEAEDWIRQLDAMSTRGRTIKVYDIKTADMETVFDMVVNVVGAPAGPKGGNPKGKLSDESSDEQSEFVTRRTHSSPDLYIQADLLSHTMLVAASAPKVAEIEDIVNRLDQDPAVAEIMGGEPPVPKLVHECQFGEASKVAWELEGVFKSIWEPSDQLPAVDTAGFGNAIVVRYPDESRFEEIRGYIAQYADKPDPKKSHVKTISVAPPPGLSAQEVAVWFKINHPELDIQLEDVGPKEEETFSIERLQPLSQATKVNPCVLPRSIERAASMLLAEALMQQEPPSPPDDEPEEVEEAYEQAPIPNADDMIRQAVQPIAKEKSKTKNGKSSEKKSGETKGSDKSTGKKKSADKESKPKEEKSKPAPGNGKVIIQYNNIDGTIQMKGAAGDLEDVDDWVDDLKSEREEIPVKPDIRIYRVKYIDVYSAQDILEEMFNLTKQQQASINAAQQAAQRAATAQARQGQPQPGGRGQQNEQGPGGPGGPNQPGGPGAGRVPPGAIPGQPGMVTPQMPAAGVRIYPNPRDRTLILRAETSLYPQILELLATIDQPKPIESFMRTYTIKNLKASEVEETLREMLGIVKGEGKGRSPRASAGTPGISAGTGPGESLPQTVTQKTVSGASELGLDPDDIKLFSSDVSNTVMAMAPIAGLDYIGKIIAQLESGDIPRRVTQQFYFKNADVDGAADYLAQYFAEKTTPSGKPRKGGAGDGAAAAASSGEKGLNSPSFIAFPQLNLLTVHATQAQMDEITGLVEKLDVKGDQDKWESVVLAYADAKVVADTLNQVYGEKAASAGGKGAAKGNFAKFVGEPGGGMVFYSAPINLREQVIESIQKLEKQYQTTGSPRIIELKNAGASRVAEAIQKAYEGDKGKGSGSSKSKFTVTAHDPTKRLFVVADDKMFKEIEGLAKLLDDKPGTIGVEFRIFPMQYASAKAVHAQLTKLLKDYLSRLGQGGQDQIEPFSVEPDEISNSLIVLGGPTVFGFIEENLRKVDTPAMAISKPGSLVFPLSNANATEVAANITKLYAGKEQALGTTPPQVEANPATNLLIIRGSQQQIDEIKRDIIDPLEAQVAAGRQLQNKPIKLKFADPAGTADVISKIFRSDSKQARDLVTAVAEHTSNSLIVSASPENMKKVEELIAKIDSADVSQQDVHVVEIKHADSASVAQTLTEIFVKSGSKQVGNQPPPITIAAVTGSRAILIKCKSEDFARISETLASLDTEDVGTSGEVRMVTLLYSDAGEVSQALEKYLTTTGGKGGKLLGDARISSMPQTNTVMISAAKEEVERLVEITKSMDVAGERASVPQIIPMKFAKADMILPSVQAVFTDTRGVGVGGRRNQIPAVIVADDGANALIVRAGPSDLASIQKIISQLDTEEAAGRTPYRLVQVKVGINVIELAEQVETTINDTAQTWGSRVRGSQASQVPRISITPNLRTNTLMIGGDSSLFAQAETLIKKLEEMGPAGNIGTRIVGVKNVKVDQMQKLIDQLTQQQGAGQGSSGGSRRPRPAGRP